MRRRTGLARWLHHLWTGPMHVRAAFPPDAMRRIEAAIGEGERRHSAELRFCVESSLDTAQLWRGLSSRERALQVFAQFGVWDTEQDNGVLVYLLWADHAVEIVADRGAVKRIDPAVWSRACEQLATACHDGRHVEGALECLATLADSMAEAYPAEGRDNPDELSNAPLVL
jgi:hypothetical protein